MDGCTKPMVTSLTTSSTSKSAIAEFLWDRTRFMKWMSKNYNPTESLQS